MLPRANGGGGPPKGRWWGRLLTASLPLKDNRHVAAAIALKRLRSVEARAPSTAQVRGPPSPLSQGRKEGVTILLTWSPIQLQWASSLIEGRHR